MVISLRLSVHRSVQFSSVLFVFCRFRPQDEFLDAQMTAVTHSEMCTCCARLRPAAISHQTSTCASSLCDVVAHIAIPSCHKSVDRHQARPMIKAKDRLPGLCTLTFHLF